MTGIFSGTCRGRMRGDTGGDGLDRPFFQSQMSATTKPDLAKKVHDLPHKPGVYLMRDRLNRVIYVGKARDLRKRVGSYFLPSRLSNADLKTRALLDSVWDFEFHTVRTEPEALLLEGRLIKEYRPRYNISFRDDKRFLLVKADMADEWPRFRLTRFKKDDQARYFGPFAHARGAAADAGVHEEAVRGADIRARRADGAGAEELDLPGADEAGGHHRPSNTGSGSKRRASSWRENRGRRSMGSRRRCGRRRRR